MHRSASSSFRTSRYSLYKKSSFIPLFCDNRLQIGNNNGSKNSTLQIEVNQQARQVLKGYDNSEFGVVSIIYSSGQQNRQKQGRQMNLSRNWAKEYCRKMFLKTYEQVTNQTQQSKNQSPFRKEKAVGQYQADLSTSGLLDLKDRQKSTSQHITIQRVNIQGIQIYNKIQVGQNEKGKPVSWFYIEVDLSRIPVDRHLLKLVAMISSHIFFEVNEQNLNDSCRRIFQTLNQIRDEVIDEIECFSSQLKQSHSERSFYSQKSVMLLNTQSEQSYDIGNAGLSHMRKSIMSNNSFSINTSVINEEEDNQQSPKDSSRLRQFCQNKSCGSVFPNSILLISSQEAKWEVSKLFEKQIAFLGCQFLNIGNSDQGNNNSTISISRSLGLKRSLSLQYDTFDNNSPKSQVKAEVLELIITNRKKYIHSMSPKLDPLKGYPITTSLILRFITEFLHKTRQIATNQKLQTKNIWRKIFNQAQNAIYKEATQIYQSKFIDLTMGKSLISHQIFEEAHKRAKNASLALIRKSTLFSYDLQLQIQQYINGKQANQKQDYSQQTFQWCKQLLHSQYQSIKRKLKAGQLRQTGSFKQEIMLFRQFFRKKSENCSSVHLIDYFQAFILDRIFEGLNTIFVFQKQDIIKQLNNQSDCLRKTQSTIQQENRKLKCQNSQLNERLTSLRDKIVNLQTNQSQMEQKISQLHRKVEQLQGLKKRDQELQSYQQQKQLSYFKKQIESLKKKAQESEKEAIQLKQQLINQKILRKQSNRTCRVILNENRQRQQQLSRPQIFSMKQSTQLQNIQLACSLRRIESPEKNISKMSDLQINLLRMKIKQLDNRIRVREEQAQRVEQRNQSMIIQLQQELQMVTKKRNELQLQINSLQQQAISMKLKISRLSEFQAQNQILEHKKQEIIDSWRQSQTQIALLKQKVQFVQSSLYEEKNDKRVLSQLVDSLTQKIQKNEDIAKSSKKNFCDQWVQVQDTVYKSKLCEAMRITQKLQNQYRKVNAQLTKYRLLGRKH